MHPNLDVGSVKYPLDGLQLRDVVEEDELRHHTMLVDPNGCIVGILTGGSGSEDENDVSYATPYYWLEESVKRAFPDSY